jgi:hypothetical protein
MDRDDIDKFRDPIWRISNLYSIRTRDGKVIPSGQDRSRSGCSR